MNVRIGAWVGLGALCVSSSGSAFGAVACVDPTDGSCFSTIQAAVDAANPGDVILIRPTADSRGYRENVVVDVSGLRLVGQGGAGASLRRTVCPAVVVDGCETPAGPTLCRIGHAFEIDAPNVTIQQLTIRHAAEGVRMTSAANGTTVRRSCFISNLGAISTETSVDDASIVRNVFHGSRNEDIDVAGNRIAVIANRFMAADDGVLVNGNDGTIMRNLFESCNDSCIAVNGLRSRVFANILRRGDDCIRVQGDEPDIQKNVVEGCSSASISMVCGACTSGTISGNRIQSNTGAVGIDIGGGNLVIANNFIRNVREAGIDINGSTNTVENNQVYSTKTGILIAGFDNTVNGNRVYRAGTESATAHAGIVVDGNENDVTENSVWASGFSAIKNEAGDSNVYRGNDIRDSGNTGIWIQEGTSNVVDENTIDNSHGEGIANDAAAAATILTDNSVSGSRTDICNDGLVSVFSGNTFTTGGIGTGCVLH